MAAYIRDITDITIILVVRRHIVVILLLFNVRLLFARFFLYTKHSRDVLLLSLCTSELLIHNFIGLSSAPKMLYYSIQQLSKTGPQGIHEGMRFVLLIHGVSDVVRAFQKLHLVEGVSCNDVCNFTHSMLVHISLDIFIKK